MHISVIICAYSDKRWDTLVAAIASVQQQSLPPYQTIVVIDNNPLLAERVRAGFTGLAVLDHQGPRGLSYARNLGTTYATGEVIAFIDDDAVADADWLSRLAQGYDDERVVGVGGYVTPSWASECPTWFPQEFNWVVGCSYRGLPTQACPVRNFIGCNMSFRRAVLVAAGSFHHELGRVGAHPVGCEETELCIRIQHAQPVGILLFEPAANVRHVIARERENWRYFLTRCYFEGRSKAIVARLIGAHDGLASERSYTRKTLPSGILHGLRDALIRGQIQGLMRTSMIVTGFCATLCGYCMGTLAKRSYVIR